MNTQCPDCNGTGRIQRDRAYLLSPRGREIGTAVVSETCKTCKGARLLPGLKPPA